MEPHEYLSIILLCFNNFLITVIFFPAYHPYYPCHVFLSSALIICFEMLSFLCFKTVINIYDSYKQVIVLLLQTIKIKYLRKHYLTGNQISNLFSKFILLHFNLVKLV